MSKEVNSASAAASTRLTLSDSTALKGMGICLMLLHHLFSDPEVFADYDVDFMFIGAHRMELLAMFARICVPIFIFVTAYGLSAKDTKDISPSFFRRRLIKLMVPFWFVFILAQIVCNMMGVRTYHEIYGHGQHGIYHFILDGLGLADAFNTPTLCSTWWYMTLAILLVCIMPLISNVAKRFGFASVLGVLVFLRISGLYPFSGYYKYFIIAFLGAAFYYSDIFGRLKSLTRGSFFRELLLFTVLAAMLHGAYIVRTSLETRDVSWILAITALAILQQHFFSYSKIYMTVMSFLGKHSMMMFLTHTFIKAYFLKSFIYSWGNCAVIWLALLLTSLALAVVIDFAMKQLGVNKLISALAR